MIILDHVTRRYTNAAQSFTALDDLSLRIDRGSFTAIIGQSGSGKSTLMNLLSGVDRPTAGEIVVDGTKVNTLSEAAVSPWRGRTIGIVFQFFQLLPTLTAAENVMLPMDFCARWPAAERRARAEALLDRLGVSDQRDKLPGTLSGGQQQRVAIARALANAPSVLLADEPTGNLDSRTAEAILHLFRELVAEGQTMVMVSHAMQVSELATHTITLADGRIVAETRRIAATTDV